MTRGFSCIIVVSVLWNTVASATDYDSVHTDHWMKASRPIDVYLSSEQSNVTLSPDHRINKNDEFEVLGFLDNMAVVRRDSGDGVVYIPRKVIDPHFKGQEIGRGLWSNVQQPKSVSAGSTKPFGNDFLRGPQPSLAPAGFPPVPAGNDERAGTRSQAGSSNAPSAMVGAKNMPLPPTSSEKRAKIDQFPGCSVLPGPLTPSAKSSLQQCANSLKAYYQGGSLAQMKRKIARLPEELSTFAALVYTSLGEADGHMKKSDYMAIMKTVMNRTRECKKSVSHCNAWAVAVMPSQFSMYNPGLYEKNPVLTKIAPQRMSLALDSFIEFQNAKFIPPEKWDRVYNYHANYVNPGWGLKRVGLDESSVNGQSLASRSPYHIFFENRSWSASTKSVNAFL